MVKNTVPSRVPTVSVAVCTYNGERFVRQQLESIAAQTVPVDEIVICDDNSTDGTVDIVKEWLAEYLNPCDSASNPCDSAGVWRAEVRLVRNPVNMGFVRNFNQAIGLCTKELLFLADQDDLWLPEKVETIRSLFMNDTAFDSHPGEQLVLVAGNGWFIDDKNRRISSLESSLESSLDVLTYSRLSRNYTDHCVEEIRDEQADLQSDSQTDSQTDSQIIVGAGCAMALRRSVIEVLALSGANLFPEGAFHDHWLADVAAMLGRCCQNRQPLFLCRVHETNTSTITRRTLEHPVRLRIQYWLQERRYFLRSVRNFNRRKDYYFRLLNLARRLPATRRQHMYIERLTDFIRYHEYRQYVRRHPIRGLAFGFRRRIRFGYLSRPQPVLCLMMDVIYYCWSCFK